MPGLIELASHSGKAVFSEKPIALDLAETQRVVEIVRKQKVPVQLGFMRRFDPGYAKAKAMIDAGELGKLETFRALSRDTYPPSYDFLLGSGGLFLDMSVHDLDLARFLVGEVEEVYACGSVLIDERFARANDADTAVTILKFKNGVLGVAEGADRIGDMTLGRKWRERRAKSWSKRRRQADHLCHWLSQQFRSLRKLSRPI